MLSGHCEKSYPDAIVLLSWSQIMESLLSQASSSLSVVSPDIHLPH